MKVQEKNKNLRGVSVRHVNYAIMGLSVILYAVLLAISFHASGEYRDMKEATDLYISCHENAAMASEGSDYLTEQVRMFTVTRDPVYMERYFNEINVDRRRELALEHLNGQASDTARTYLTQALERSNQLTELEIYAMRLVAEAEGLSDLPQQVLDTELFPGHMAMSDEEKIDYAMDRVFGEEYQAKKALVNDNITAFVNDVMSTTLYRQETSMSDLRRALTSQLVACSVMLLLIVLIFMMITFLIVKPLQVYIRCIKEDKRMEITGAYEFKYLALTYNDIYELNAENEMLMRNEAELDPLTGILSRDAFEQAKRLTRLKPRPIGLLLVDLDMFKELNDGYGREAGDKVLKKVASMLENHFRATDYPARIGGDEFAVIIDEMGPDTQRAIIQKMQNINRLLSHPKDGLPSVTVSAGGAFSTEGFTDELYRKADVALFEVKRSGRKACKFYEDEVDSQNNEPAE